MRAKLLPVIQRWLPFLSGDGSSAGLLTQQQRRIDSFYHTYHDNTRFAQIRSHRLRNAVHDKRKVPLLPSAPVVTSTSSSSTSSSGSIASGRDNKKKPKQNVTKKRVMEKKEKQVVTRKKRSRQHEDEANLTLSDEDIKDGVDDDDDDDDDDAYIPAVGMDDTTGSTTRVGLRSRKTCRTSSKQD